MGRLGERFILVKMQCFAWHTNFCLEGGVTKKYCIRLKGWRVVEFLIGGQTSLLIIWRDYRLVGRGKVKRFQAIWMKIAVIFVVLAVGIAVCIVILRLKLER